MKKARGYVATASWKSHEACPFTAEMLDLIRRRTEPFLDNIGLQTTPLAHIVQEVYLQGLKDAIDALNHRDAPPQNDKGPPG